MPRRINKIKRNAEEGGKGSGDFGRILREIRRKRGRRSREALERNKFPKDRDSISMGTIS